MAAGWLGWFAHSWTGLGTAPTRRDLRTLPGQFISRAFGVSEDGSTIVGSSGTRAFRWRDGVMEDLGQGVAVAASADGSVVLGESFLWDAAHGRRDLRAAIEADFGVDLSRWERVIGTDLSPDAQTLVGAAAWPRGPLRAFRARRNPAVCPPVILADQEPLVHPEYVLGWFDMSASPAVAPDGTVFVGGYRNPRVIRTQVLETPGVPRTLDVVLDLTEEEAYAFVLTAGPGGEGYIGTSSERLLRIDPDGTVMELLDGSVFPKPVTTWWDHESEILREQEVPTQPSQIALAPDGTIFVAAVARALQIDPDGGVSELFDLATIQEWFGWEVGSIQGGVFLVQRFPDGRLIWGDGNFAAVTDESGNLLTVLDEVEVRAVRVTDDGGLWTAGYGSFTYRTPQGVREEFHQCSSDGTCWEDLWGWKIELDVGGNLWFTAASSTGLDPHILRRSPDGEITPVHPAGSSFSLAGDFILVADRSSVNQIRPFSHCRNGRDDDGDALVDLADPGCSGALDPSERSDGLPCDDGLDNDGDGLADLHDDPGCAGRTAATESPECDDGLDNDGDGRIDWNGGGVGAPDAQCGDNPAAASEGPACGLGFELALLAPIARRMRRRQGRIAPAVLSGIPR